MTKVGVSEDALEKALVILAMFSFTGAVFPLLYQQGAQDNVITRTDPLSPALHTLAYLMAPFFAWRRGIFRWSDLAPPGSVLVLLALAGASVMWSIDPGRAARAFILLVAGGIFATYVARRFTMSEQLTLLASMLTLVMICSLITVVFAPSYGIEPGLHSGSWRGAFTRKNTFGVHVALAFAVFLCWGYQQRQLKLIGYFMAGAAFILSVLSRSATAVGTCAAIVVLFLLLRMAARGRVRKATLLSAGLVLVMGTAFVATHYWTEILNLLGRDATLSGRTFLWALLFARVLEHPWLGYGVQAFWLGKPQLYVEIWDAVGWAPPHAHNGFLDLALDLGVVGVVAFLGGFVFECRRAFTNMIKAGLRPETLWPAVFLGFFFLSNLTETRILRHTSFLWIVYVSALTTSLSTARERSPKTPRASLKDPATVAPQVQQA